MSEHKPQPEIWTAILHREHTDTTIQREVWHWGNDHEFRQIVDSLVDSFPGFDLAFLGQVKIKYNDQPK
jgi:hypothetical protein